MEKIDLYTYIPYNKKTEGIYIKDFVKNIKDILEWIIYDRYWKITDKENELINKNYKLLQTSTNLNNLSNKCNNIFKENCKICEDLKNNFEENVDYVSNQRLKDIFEPLYFTTDLKYPFYDNTNNTEAWKEPIDLTENYFYNNYLENYFKDQLKEISSKKYYFTDLIWITTYINKNTKTNKCSVIIEYYDYYNNIWNLIAQFQTKEVNCEDIHC